MYIYIEIKIGDKKEADKTDQLYAYLQASVEVAGKTSKTAVPMF